MGAFASHLSAPSAPHGHATSLDALNATLGGRVFFAVPFSRPCFHMASKGVPGHSNAIACENVIEIYTERDAVAAHFGAYLNSAGTICQATGEQCLLDNSDPSNSQAFLPPKRCEQGNLPTYYIDIRSADDVTTAFDFSRRTGMPLSIKNTGHDYLSRSSGSGSLALWMHNLQDISYNTTYVPSGCNHPGVAAVTFGTGVLTGKLNEFADAHNVTIPGGADSSIAFGGGYLLGGGHSAFSNALGLAVDQVLQFEVVTPDGKHRFANACSDPDLFFALRGGGGATFGVVLRVTMRALPQLDFPVVITAFKGKPSEEAQAKYVEFLIENALSLASKGWGGYIEPGLGLTFVNPFASMDEAANTMAGLQRLVETELNGTFLLQRETSYLSFYNRFVGPTTIPDNAPSALASRLIPTSIFNTSAARVALHAAVTNAAQRHTITLLFAVAPYFFESDGAETSVTRAWREALWQVIYIDYWAYNTTVQERAEIYRGLEDDIQALREIAPVSGVYSNEASVFEPDYTEAFWGANHARLLAIKRKYDPDHLLDCWKCVGWRGASDARYKCQQRL